MDFKQQKGKKEKRFLIRGGKGKPGKGPTLFSGHSAILKSLARHKMQDMLQK